jgi:hypothetical protein
VDRFRFICLSLVLVSSTMLAQSNPVPLISQPLVPASVAPGGTGFTLTVNGVGFVSGAAVYWNGSIRPTSLVSSSTVQAQISAADVASVGAASVTVGNPSPGGVVSNVIYFPIRNSALGLGFLPKNNALSKCLGQPTIVGDFNGDGKLDVAVGVGTKLEICIGKGNGSFKPPIVTNSAVHILQMVAGDFNGDGILDIAVLSGKPDHFHIAIFLGRGDGTFIQKKSFIASSHPSFLGVADFNGDGKLDLYIDGSSKYGGSFFEVLLGNGDGTFDSGNGFGGGVTMYGSYLPAFGDFNGDGRVDLALVDFDGKVEVFLNNGNGFQNGVSYPLTFGGTNVAVADINGDGKVDLVTDGVSVLLGNGDGTFKDDGGVSLPLTGGSANVGDFNGDGKLDIAAGLSMLLGNGDGTFQSPLTFAGLFSQPVTMGDFNGDGKLDLVSKSGSTLSLVVQVRVYLTPVNLDFGTQNVGTTSPPQPATLTNFDAHPLIINSIKITGTNSADFAQTNNCGSGLPPNGSCTIQVTFTPSFAGQESASLNVSYHGSGTLSMPLTGIGENLPTVTLTPSSLTYPLQIIGTMSQPQTATLTNTGSQPVIISNISATTPFSQTNNCPSSLAVGKSCQIQVTFTPTIRGTSNGTLSVTDNAVGSPQTVALSGTGTAVMLSPISINFGNQKVGSKSVPIPITLTNVDTTSLTITQIKIKGTNAGDFAQTNNCGNSVPPKGQCTITVTFTPTVKGKRSAEVSITDNGGGSPQMVPLAGTGT